MRLLKKIITNQILVGFLTFLLFWELLYLGMQNQTIPSPIEAFSYGWQIRSELLMHTLGSFARVSAAIIISLAIGLPLGLIIGRSKLADRILSPFLYYLYPIPKVAFLPVFMILFGLGNFSKITLMVWIIFIQIILSIRDGVYSIDSLKFKVMDSFHATNWQVFRFLLFPAILPYLFSSLRISIGIALAALFFAENYDTTYGLGYLITSAWTKMNYPEMFISIVVLGFLGLLFFKLLDTLENKFVPYLNK